MSRREEGRRMFISSRAVTQIRATIIAAVVLAAVVGAYYLSGERESDQPVDGFQYVTPEEVGWSSQKLDSVKQLAEESGYAAIMAAYDGKVFFSWGEVDRNFRVHSIRKPFESALYGIHVDRGEIDLNQTLEQPGIDDIPPSLTSAEKQATVRELLQARSGVYHEAAAEAPSMIELRRARRILKTNGYPRPPSNHDFIRGETDHQGTICLKISR